jgi:RNA polymerase sigma-70 factor (ECF subfamily)
MSIPDAELSELYMRYAPVLHARARSILGNDAEAGDAVQETFARLIRGYDGFRGESSPLTWLYRVNTNWCLNQLRNRKGHQKKAEERRADVQPREEVAPDVDRIDDERVRALLADADDETRRIVVALFFDELTKEEAAVEVGISVPTLRKRLDAFLRRARRDLGVALVVATLLWFALPALRVTP